MTIQSTAASVQEFVSLMSGPTPKGVQRFYRGVTKQVGIVNPSVFRSDLRRRNEKLMFDQLLAMNPSDFVGDTTTLDKLVRMQHHGLPTRLLDITANPLMALFFACDGDARKNAEVLCFHVVNADVKFPDSDRASVMANLARLTPEQASALDPTLSQDEFNDPAHSGKLLHFIKQEKPYFLPLILPRHIKSIMVIRAKWSNRRITAQAGAFLLFGNDAQFETHKGARILRRVVTIPAGAKAQILRELDHLAINRSTVYPSLESSARYIAKPFPAD
jgi:hypothetical protein